MTTQGCQINLYLPSRDRGPELLTAITDVLVAKGFGIAGDDQEVRAIVALRAFEWSDDPRELLDRAEIDEAVAVSIPANPGVSPPKFGGNGRGAS